MFVIRVFIEELYIQRPFFFIVFTLIARWFPMDHTEVYGYLTEVQIAEVDVAGLDFSVAIHLQVHRDTIDDVDRYRAR